MKPYYQENGTVIDCFFGAGTTAVVTHKLKRKCIGTELSKTYLDDIAIPRLKRENAQIRMFA